MLRKDPHRRNLEEEEEEEEEELVEEEEEEEDKTQWIHHKESKGYIQPYPSTHPPPVPYALDGDDDLWLCSGLL